MRRYQPSLLGGLFIGIVSALPIVGALNYCCCLWVVTGGLLTTWLQQQGRTDALDTAEAALGGLLSGLIGAVIYVVFHALLFSMSGDSFEAALRTMVEQYPQMPADLRDRMLGMGTGRNMILIMTAVTLPLYAVFGMLGALLGLALFRKPSPPPPAVS